MNRKIEMVYCKQMYKAKIHDVLDPIWKNEKTFIHRKAKRNLIYNYLSAKLGKEYHTAEIKTLNEAQQVYYLLQEFVLKYGFKKTPKNYQKNFK